MKRDEWICGYAAAIAGLIRDGERSAIKNLLTGDGLKLENFKKAGVEDYDLDEIKKIFKKQP